MKRAVGLDALDREVAVLDDEVALFIEDNFCERAARLVLDAVGAERERAGVHVNGAAVFSIRKELVAGRLAVLVGLADQHELKAVLDVDVIRIGYAGKARIHVDVVRIGLAHVERLVAGVVDEIVTRKDEALGLVGHAVLFELMDRIEREVVHCVAEEFDVDLAVAEGFGQGAAHFSDQVGAEGFVRKGEGAPFELDARRDARLDVAHVGRRLDHLTVHGTPAFFPVGGRDFHAFDHEVMEDLIKRRLQRTRAAHRDRALGLAVERNLVGPERAARHRDGSARRERLVAKIEHTAREGEVVVAQSTLVGVGKSQEVVGPVAGGDRDVRVLDRTFGVKRGVAQRDVGARDDEVARRERSALSKGERPALLGVGICVEAAARDVHMALVDRGVANRGLAARQIEGTRDLGLPGREFSLRAEGSLEIERIERGLAAIDAERARYGGVARRERARRRERTLHVENVRRHVLRVVVRPFERRVGKGDRAVVGKPRGRGLTERGRAVVREVRQRSLGGFSRDRAGIRAR